MVKWGSTQGKALWETLKGSAGAAREFPGNIPRLLLTRNWLDAVYKKADRDSACIYRVFNIGNARPFPGIWFHIPQQGRPAQEVHLSLLPLLVEGCCSAKLWALVVPDLCRRPLQNLFWRKYVCFICFEYWLLILCLSLVLWFFHFLL